MKPTLILFALLTIRSFGQKAEGTDVLKRMEGVSTLSQAITFIQENPELKGEIEFLDSEKDSSDISKTLMAKKNEEVISINKTIYKIVESRTTHLYRASYIYFDGSKMTNAQVDSLRDLIVMKLNNGTPFSELSKKYNMDGNPRGDDLGWFENGQMVKEFEEAVKNAKTGNIIKLDVPALGWHYLIKKTFDNRQRKVNTVLKIKGGTG